MKALVISGGGSKGAFAIGVLKRLFAVFPKLGFDLCVGTSTGALIVPFIAVDEMETLEKLYTTHRTEDILLKSRLGDRLNDVSIFDASPLKNLINTNYPDSRYDELLQTGRKLFITTTCLQTGALVVYTNSAAAAATNNYEVKQVQNADHFRRAVLASACQPIFMQPVKVNVNLPRDKDRLLQYVDGGVKEYIGVQMAIDNGATEIFIISLSSDAPAAEQPELKDLFSILTKTVDILTEDVSKNDLLIPQQFNEALEYVAAVKKKMAGAGIPDSDISSFFNIPGNPFANKVPVKLYLVKPDEPLGGGPGGLEFDPVAMQALLKRGMEKADQFIASLGKEIGDWA